MNSWNHKICCKDSVEHWKEGRKEEKKKERERENKRRQTKIIDKSGISKTGNVKV
jgi:hypothetical protein